MFPETVVALIPAHNEQDGIAAAVIALREQTRPPERIIVVCDNCTDDTPIIARSLGCEVWETRGNQHKKAGALNQVLRYLLVEKGGLADDDVVLVQDADSFLDPTFIERGLSAYGPGIGGVGGVFRGRIDAPTRWGRLIQQAQASEYSRYELDIRRQRGRVLVLTGTATLLRVSILREVVRARVDGRLPGEATVYDTRVLTEDNELSFALMRLGYAIRSPLGCTLSTETMPSLKALAQQRLRWKRGAVENLMDYGWSRKTAPYWGRQALAVVGIIVTAVYLATLVYGVAFGMNVHLFWIGVTALFGMERAVTVRKRGPRAMAVAALVFVEFFYDLFLQGVQAVAYTHTLIGQERSW